MQYRFSYDNEGRIKPPHDEMNNDKLSEEVKREIWEQYNEALDREVETIRGRRRLEQAEREMAKASYRKIPYLGGTVPYHINANGKIDYDDPYDDIVDENMKNFI